jgi:anti-sigma regulatory factor (Ser/Thr protein kinase)
MELIPADGHCIAADGIIVWCDTVFKEWFSHRGIGPGTGLGQLFPATGEYRPGTVYEDADELGKKRFFAMECTPTLGPNGEKVSDSIRIRKITLQRVLTDISRLSTRTMSSKELFEKILWLLRDTTHYLAFAGFIARDGSVELVASKGWTEKLKSYVLRQAIAPDSPSLTGRTAYYRRQVAMAMEDYGLSPAVKSAIDKLGGEYLVTTPLLDREVLVGVLTVINDKALTPADLEALQAICGQAASALDLKLQEEAAAVKADDAVLLANIAARAMEDAVFLQKASLKSASSAFETGKALDVLLRSLNENAPMEDIPLGEACEYAIARARKLAEAAHKRLNVRTYGLDNVEASPLLKFAIYEALKNSVLHSTSPSVDVTLRALKERSGKQRIEISDNGPGIPDEYKSEAFRPHKANMKNPGGVGLYIVKKIARINNGRVWVGDRVHGDYRKGASIVITIPVR